MNIHKGSKRILELLKLGLWVEPGEGNSAAETEVRFGQCRFNMVLVFSFGIRQPNYATLTIAIHIIIISIMYING